VIFRTGFSEKQTGLAVAIRAFGAALFRILRDGMEARAGAVSGARDFGNRHRSRW